MYVLVTLTLFFSFLLFSTSNAVFVILLVISLFLCGSCSFFFFSSYVALVFIIVYVGAIAVLFLFVIMLTNNLYFHVPEFFTNLVFLMSVTVFIDVILVPVSSFFSVDGFFFFSYIFVDLTQKLLFWSESLSLFGYVFYNVFFFYITFIGFLLLLVLIGVVLLLRQALHTPLQVTRSTLVLTKLERGVTSTINLYA